MKAPQGALLAIREESLGSYHLDIATTLDNLARLCHSKGKYGEAERLHRRALAI
jgi:Tetratricopeptide repeat